MKALFGILTLTLALGAGAQTDLDQKIATHKPRPSFAPNQPLAEHVAYGPKHLFGRVYKPAGDGPFGVVLWNHGSEKDPGPQPELAAFYNAHGYVLFAPVRSGHGNNPGPYIVDEQKDADPAGKVALHDKANEDVAAALEWIRAQPYVDRERIFISGVSYGGIQTVISAERLSGVRGFIAFAPGAMSWGSLPVQKRLLEAVDHARAPVFVLQAANDYNTGPVEVLGAELRRRGGLNRAKLYPRFGAVEDHQKGHAAFATWDLGTEIWGADVLGFMGDCLKGR
ncbi:MAG: prolyl oligopeptidase family serine peptidase [Acidobacteriota bacterium]